MKRQIFWAAFLGAITSSLFAQGTISFSTRIVGQVDAPMSVAGCGVGLYPNMTAQLFLVAGGSYTALYPTTTFHKTNTAANRYVVVPDEPVVVPGVHAGQQATIVMRVFDGISYESSSFRGESAPITITLGGTLPEGTSPPPPPVPPATLAGLQGFQSLALITFIGWVAREADALRITVCNNYPTYVVYASSDLSAWQPWVTNAANNFTVPIAPGSLPKYFRATGRFR